MCTEAKLAHTLTIGELAKHIGNLAASMEEVFYEIIFYKQLESDKIKQTKGHFEANITLKHLFKKELTWWENNTKPSTESLRTVPLNATIYTDAILDGWWAVLGKSETSGMWTKQEQELHISILELLGAKPELFNFFKDNAGISILRP